jgi:hypothetical protein
MQRGAVRATVGGVAVDIPLGTFTAGQALRYSNTGGPGGVPGIDSVALPTGDFVGPGASVSGNIVSFNGATGKLGQDSGVSATAHGARHKPNGADSSFTGTFVANDLALFDGTNLIPKFRGFGFNTATQVCAVTALADMTGHTFTLTRSATYYFRCAGAYRTNATTTGLRLSAQYSGTSSAYNGAMWVNTSATGAAAAYFAQTALNTAMGSGSGPGAVDAEFWFQGRIVTTSGGTFAIRIASEVAVASGVTLAIGALTEL